MHYLEKKGDKIKGITITKEGERTFTARISVNIHTPNKNAHTDACALVYTDALLSGCGSYSREAFLDAVNLLGASISITILNDVLTFSLTSLDTNRTKLLALFSTLIQKPVFAPKELQRIRVQTKNELIEEKEDARSKAVHQLVNTMYAKGDHRYTADEDVLITELQTVTKAELVALHNSALSAQWVYTLTGTPKDALQTVKVLETLRDTFGVTRTSEVTQTPRPLEKTVVVTHAIPSKQNIEIGIGAPLPFTQSSKDYFAFLFGINVLGKWGGFAGRLMSTVREKEGLTYGIYAKTETATLTTSGYWRIMTFFAPNKVMQGITSTLREIDLIKTKGITQSEYERFKTILNTQETLQQDSLLEQVGYTQSLQLRGFDLEGIKKRKQNLLNVTRSEVNAALKKYLDTTKLVISAAGPIASAKQELKALERIAKTAK